AVQKVDNTGASRTAGHGEYTALLEIAVETAAVLQHDVFHGTDTNKGLAAIVDVGGTIAVKIPSLPVGIPAAAKAGIIGRGETGEVIHLGVGELGLVAVEDIRSYPEPVIHCF